MSPHACAKWLKLMGYGFVAFGLVWITTAFAVFDSPGRLLIDTLDWPMDGSPSSPSEEARWMGAIGAGLTCALGLIIANIVSPLIARDEAEVGKIVRKGMLVAITTWMIVDSIGSVTSGVPSNAVFNAIFYLALAVPLWQVKFNAPTA